MGNSRTHDWSGIFSFPGGTAGCAGGLVVAAGIEWRPNDAPVLATSLLSRATATMTIRTGAHPARRSTRRFRQTSRSFGEATPGLDTSATGPLPWPTRAPCPASDISTPLIESEFRFR